MVWPTSPPSNAVYHAQRSGGCGRVLIAVLLLLSAVSPLAALPPDNAAVVGVWTSKMDSLPTISLTVEEENGKLIGAVLFYSFVAILAVHHQHLRECQSF
jgi:hypothetical protein